MNNDQGYSQMGETTRTALEAITNEDSFKDIDSVVNYIVNDSNFKMLPQILRDAMVIADARLQNASERDLADELINKLKECDPSFSQDGTIRNWFNGTTRSISTRKQVVEICLALHLDLKSSNELLNKCGYNSFFARDPYDVICVFCIKSNKTMKKADEIFEKYNAKVNKLNPANSNLGLHSGETTVALEQVLFDNLLFTDEDDFLNDFLIPNANNYISFSVTALNEYYLQKNRAYFSVIYEMYKDEMPLKQERSFEVQETGAKIQDATFGYSKKEIPITLGFRSAICKQEYKNNPQSLLYSAYKVFDRKKQHWEITDKHTDENTERTYTLESLKHIYKLINEKTDLASQIEISYFLDDVITSFEGFLKHVIPSVRNKENDRLKKYGDSIINNSVLKQFPKAQTLSKFEKNPMLIYKDLSFRKSLILLFYIKYVYDFTNYLYGDTEDYNEDVEMGFSAFYTELNKLLEKCRLSPLYPANQFDWLILRSVWEIESENNYDYEIGDNPIEASLKFFNDVIEYSFEVDR